MSPLLPCSRCALQNDSPQRRAHLHPSGLCLHYLTGQKGLRRCDGTEDLEISLGYLGELNVTISVRIRARQEGLRKKEM